MGVGASIAMEAIPSRWRGLLSGMLQEGYAVGYLLAAGAYFLIFPHFGWRPMFFIGGAPALLTLYIRSKVPESKAWERMRPRRGRDLRSAIRRHLGLFAYLVLLMTMMNLVSHGTQDLYPTFLEKGRGLEPRTVAMVAIIYNVGALAGGLIFGWLSDRWGRRRAMVAAVLIGVHGGAAVDISAVDRAADCRRVPDAVHGAGRMGTIPAHLVELSPSAVRGLFSGLAYQLGVLSRPTRRSSRR